MFDGSKGAFGGEGGLSLVAKSHSLAMTPDCSRGGFRREVQPRRQHWFLNEKSGFPFRTPAFCSVSRGQRRLGEKEYRAPSVTPGVALRPRTQGPSLVTFVSIKPTARVPARLDPFENPRPGRPAALTPEPRRSFCVWGAPAPRPLSAPSA